jgi:hypothetical protein
MGGSRSTDTNGVANCVLLCIYCHAHIEKQREASLFAGWLVRQGHDPATVPVFRYGSEWVLLDDYGYVTQLMEGS